MTLESGLVGRLPEGLHGAGVWDALTGRIVQDSGFDFAYLSGFALEATQLAAPDVGLTTLSELVSQLSRIVDAVDLPVLCDVDTGFGGLNNVWRTAREVRRAGGAGLQIEDQANPKRCPVLPGRVVISRSEAVERVAAAVDGASDDDFLILARTDADEIGFDEVVARCNSFLEAGAQAVLPIMTVFEGADRRSLPPDRQMEVLRQLASAVSGPLATTAPPPGYTAADMLGLGFSIVIHPIELLQASMTALRQSAEEISRAGMSAPYFSQHPATFPNADTVLRYLGVDTYITRDND